MNEMTPVAPRRPYMPPTLETLSDSQIDVIRNLQPHADFVAPVIGDKRPAGIFLDDERFALERDKVFRNLPVPVTISAAIAEPGTVLAHDHYGCRC